MLRLHVGEEDRRTMRHQQLCITHRLFVTRPAYVLPLHCLLLLAGETVQLPIRCDPSDVHVMS